MASRPTFLLFGVLLGILLLNFAFSAPAPAASPSFCHHLDCPKYNVTYSNSTANLEIRVYEQVKWVRTNVSELSNFTLAMEIGFMKLFDYISGANVNGSKIPMAAPVTNKIIPGAGPACDTVFQISFFIPFEFQDNPPLPTNDTVFIADDPELTRAVYQFGGFANKWNEVLPPIKDLHDALTSYGQYDFNPNINYVCGYDSPYHVFNRHNEIWVDVHD